MKVWVTAFALVMACKSAKDKDKDPVTPAAKAAATVPTVGVATVLATGDANPPFLLLLDDSGMVRLGAAKTWADLDANTLTLGKKPSKPESVDRYIRERFAVGLKPVESVTGWDDVADMDLGTRDTSDDPPPPPEEDKPDDGKDESGGTGTAMALDEGKMGRAEGQYKMQHPQEDPQLARQQAIEAARAAGILGTVASARGGVIERGRPNEDGLPSRTADIAGVVKTDGKFEHLRSMIVVAPSVKATVLIEAVKQTDAAIAVSNNGKVRPLNIQFGLFGNEMPWLEVRVSAKGLVVEAVPDKPVDVAAIDQLGATIAKLRTDGDEPVDILVDPDITTQRLIDVTVALDTAGIKVIGMGGSLTPGELARRGHKIPTTRLGQPNTQGDLDKSEIRRVVKKSKREITHCYEKALMAAPDLGGTVQTQFFIKPDGTVVTVAASGVSPEVSDCVAAVIKTLVFPKPKGGGGVQVNYPFVMHP